jgi:predicted AAA+ superfamily ATPase
VAARRVTIVTGPRQSGKTTLVRSQHSGAATMRSLDEQGVLDAALEDPARFVALGGRPLIIDEVHRGGEPLVRAIKAQVDRDSSPGQFVLTGSSNFLTVPTISESLTAGRAFWRCGRSPKASWRASVTALSTSSSQGQRH